MERLLDSAARLFDPFEVVVRNADATTLYLLLVAAVVFMLFMWQAFQGIVARNWGSVILSGALVLISVIASAQILVPAAVNGSAVG